MDRIAICEAYWLLGCDYGLYALVTRIERMGYSPGLSARNGRPSDETVAEIYAANEARAARTDPYAVRMVSA